MTTTKGWCGDQEQPGPQQCFVLQMMELLSQQLLSGVCHHIRCCSVSQMFQVEQRLQRVQQQLKEMRQATADADPERKCWFRLAGLKASCSGRPLQLCAAHRPAEEAGGGGQDQLLYGVGEAAQGAGGHEELSTLPPEGGSRARHGPG